ncbi:MAG: sugar ABC transporter permease [Eubacteriales bacterium]|nr:sugar ABC transporter permease [Eubacteriales bacterium]
MSNTPIKRIKSVSYAKWGYFFIAPFFLVYLIFHLIPLGSTIYNSFFENYRSGLSQIGPKFVGFQNYITLFQNGELPKYAWNTLVIWMMGFVPQILVAMLLAVWFTSYRLKLKGQPFFKTVIYMPNLIMASAFAMLFFLLFSAIGPVNQFLIQAKILSDPLRMEESTTLTRSLIALMNFLMWFGNTTIVLMAGIMGIDQSLFDAAQVDGAKPRHVFYRVTLPMLKPIVLYVIITCMIGGIQMFDVPQILTNFTGEPNRIAMTLVMFLNKHLQSKNLGMGGAVSVLIFLITAALSILVFQSMTKEMRAANQQRKQFAKAEKEAK